MSSNNNWLIAVGICVVASTISNFGLNLQKLALTRKALRIGSKSAYRTLWILGFFGIVGGAIGDFAALVFGGEWWCGCCVVVVAVAVVAVTVVNTAHA